MLDQGAAASFRGSTVGGKQDRVPENGLRHALMKPTLRDFSWSKPMRPIVRVLIVTDSNGGFLQWRDQSAAEAVGANPRHFHLGEFVSVLTATPWLGFNVEITNAHREAAAQGQSDADFKAQVGADVINFRFDQPFTVNGTTRTLAGYDMALFFAIATGNANPALASEAAAVAQFMENGGGFFATGDHQNLGGTLCSQLPRVRSMRRWYFQGPF
jgi:hypothetical protein